MNKFFAAALFVAVALLATGCTTVNNFPGGIEQSRYLEREDRPVAMSAPPPTSEPAKSPNPEAPNFKGKTEKVGERRVSRPIRWYVRQEKDFRSDWTVVDEYETETPPVVE